ncbi:MULTISPECIES: bifunctional diguanylate cyclase/phosphodiesterase [Streptacidiphilus]|uniref:Bifunctional diguanylate cyclase/phosphodiesterase n=2 Tax=Streptacidiphilus TaxID=228398 RepID=A0ABV6UV65_9ACTN|nr:EAL domain-containing protein [Streptacidiphilus jeojiense]
MSTKTVLPGPPWAEEHSVPRFSVQDPVASVSDLDPPGLLSGSLSAYEAEEPREEAPQPGPASRLPRLLILLLCLGYLIGSASGWGSPGLADFMGDFGLSGAALTASLSCLGYSCTAAGRHRPAWLCFGLSSLMVAVGNGVWGWYEVVLRVPIPTPSIADYAFLMFAPPAILGLLLLAKRPRNAAGWLCLALDGWLIAGSLLTLSWSLALARTAHGDSGSPLRLSMALAYPVLDILLVSMVLGLRFRSRDSNRAAVHTAMVALALTVLCDALFTSQALRDAYHSGQLLDAGWFTGSMLLAWAPWARPSGNGGAAAPGGGRTRVASTFSALTPYAAAAVCTAGLIYNAFAQRQLDRFVLIVACTVVFALILRQGIMLLDNLSLAQKLSHQENHFRSLVQGSSDVIMIADPDGVLRYVSPAATGVYGRPAEELVGTRLPEMVHPDDLGHVLWEVQRYLAQSPAQEPTARIECRVRSGAGEWLDVESTVNRYRDGLIFNCRDVSERVRLQAQLEHNAFHDALTDLPNRALFLNRGRTALNRMPAAEGVAVLFLDLDGFKAVNDTAGHQVGDELLVQAARRLQDTVRSGDTVARLGGDEFAVLLVGLDQEQAAEVAERLRAALSAPYWIGSEELGVAASIGIAFAEPGITPARLLRNADLAMYRAKKNGKGRVAVYDPQLRTELHRRTELEQRLRLAVREGQFALLHQPVVDLGSGEVVALSAQARWRSAQGLLLTPAEFQRASEGGDRAARFTRWMVEQALQLSRERRERLGATVSQLPVAVRLSARRLAVPGLCETIEAMLLRSGLPAESLLLEITEGEAADGRPHHSDELVRRLTALRKLGIGLALDGFGGPGAPLSGLRLLPVDMIKVERGLVEGLVESAFLQTLTTSVLRLGQELGLTTAAEGVDQAAQAALLRRLGCQRGQGRYFSGPLPEEELDAVLCGPGFDVPDAPAEGSQRLVHPSGESRSDLRLHRPGHPRTNSDQQGRSRGSHLGLGPHDETSIPPA